MAAYLWHEPFGTELRALLSQGGRNGHFMNHLDRLHRRFACEVNYSGTNEPSGFILTTLLGVAGAFVATYLGQALGWYSAGEGAGLIGATAGAIIVLLVWGAIASRRKPTVP